VIYPTNENPDLHQPSFYSSPTEHEAGDLRCNNEKHLNHYGWVVYLSFLLRARFLQFFDGFLGIDHKISKYDVFLQFFDGFLTIDHKTSKYDVFSSFSMVS
jgi:hypothetical protein